MVLANERPVIPISGDIKNKTLPNIAVCLAAFNGVRWLPEQLDSVLKQTAVLVTVIVSVDRSTDGTEEWINQRAADDERILVLPHGESFGGAARNFFRLIRDVNLSGFDYVSFSDQDDIWLENKLSRAVDAMSRSGIAGYSSNVIAFWPDGRKLPIIKSQSQRKWDYLFEAAGPGCTYVLNRELADSIKKCVIANWVDIQCIYLHDWFFYAFARANGYKWFIDDVPCLLYRQHNDNQVGINKGFLAIINRLKKVLGGYGLEQSCRIATLVGLSENEFFMTWKQLRRKDIIKLSFKAMQCRRRLRDQFFFFFVCLLLSVMPRNYRD